MTDTDSVATHFRRCRMGQQLSMRDVEERTALLGAERPDIYDTVSRTMISQLELQGMPRVLAMDHRALRALIHVIFGSVEAFTNATGFDPHLSSAHATEQTIPEFMEGESITPKTMLSTEVRQRTSLVQGAQYAVVTRNPDLVPVLYPGQVVYAQPSNAHTPGALCVLYRHGRLALAYAVAGDRFAVPQGKSTFALSYPDALIGVAVSIEPTIPHGFLDAETLPERAAS